MSFVSMYDCVVAFAVDVKVPVRRYPSHFDNLLRLYKCSPARPHACRPSPLRPILLPRAEICIDDVGADANPDASFDDGIVCDGSVGESVGSVVDQSSSLFGSLGRQRCYALVGVGEWRVGAGWGKVVGEVAR